jgi:AraC-like DNA-binding protein
MMQISCMRNPVYREHAPPAGLSSHIECFWTVHSNGAVATAIRNRVLPDACADVIFDFGERDLRSAPGDDGLRSAVVGTMTAAVVIEQVGRIDMLGVRFRPGCASAFLRLPLGDATNRTFELEALGEGWQATTRRMHAADRAEERVTLLLAALADRFRPDAMADRVIGGAWSRITASGGALSVRTLAASIGVGERRLQRLFHERVGLSPKEAARVVRFRSALLRMQRHPDRPLGRIGLEAGYYDQPHFNREFARFAGLPPAGWRRERGAPNALVRDEPGPTPDL